MDWEFVPFEGIKSKQIAITLGTSRELLRARLRDRMQHCGLRNLE